MCLHVCACACVCVEASKLKWEKAMYFKRIHTVNLKKNNSFNPFSIERETQLLFSLFLTLIFSDIRHCHLGKGCDGGCPDLAPPALLWLPFSTNL